MYILLHHKTNLLFQHGSGGCFFQNSSQLTYCDGYQALGGVILQTKKPTRQKRKPTARGDVRMGAIVLRLKLVLQLHRQGQVPKTRIDCRF